MKEHDIEEFEFSQAYLFFWDKVRRHLETRYVVKRQLLEMWRFNLLFLFLSD
jgi:aminopeptidase C